MRKKSASLSLRETVALFREVRHGTERTLSTLCTMRKSEREREIAIPWKIGCRWSVFGSHLSIRWRSRVDGQDGSANSLELNRFSKHLCRRFNE